VSKIDDPFSHLVVIHYHWRPGGVRKVIELTLPAILRSAPRELEKLTLLSGSPESEHPLIEGLGGRVAIHSAPALDYFSEQSQNPKSIGHSIGETLRAVIPDQEAERTLIWFHNPGLARNAILNQEVLKFCETSGSTLILHHHDFWCSGRWARWQEMERCGWNTLEKAAGITLGATDRSVQVTINLSDLKSLAGAMGDRVFHLPNPVLRPKRGSSSRIKNLQKWVEEELQTTAPLWVCPTRFLRRKNLLEAILLTRWLRPDAVFVTTSGKASGDELPYARMIRDAAEQGGWNVRFGILDKPGSPRVDEVLRVAEVALLTSVQEGFGMGFVEASACGIPLIARALPDVMPDLEAMGFQFPHLYPEVYIAPTLIDISAESHRQIQLRLRAKGELPSVLSSRFQPEMIDFEQPIAFSRLTWQGQVEVLNRSPMLAWEACRSLNPVLEKIHSSLNKLESTPWPVSRIPSPSRYARAFWKLANVAAQSTPTNADVVLQAQSRLIDRGLCPAAFFPVQAERFYQKPE
jgi:glycosyltransferase involved in cell wall biosynthesis